MKKFIGTILFLLALTCFHSAYAGQGTFALLSPESDYTISQSTITISSYTVTTVEASMRFQEVYIGDPTTTVSIFYRMDGSTQSIPTVGWWIPAGKGQRIESNETISLQLEAGESAINVRKMIFTK